MLSLASLVGMEKGLLFRIYSQGDEFGVLRNSLVKVKNMVRVVGIGHNKN